MIKGSMKKLITTKKRRHPKKARLEKIFSWFCQKEKSIDDGGDESKKG
jgi:hypothetical protein